MSEERIPLRHPNGSPKALTFDGRPAHIAASDIGRRVAMVVGRMAQSCRIYAREHCSECTMEAFLGFLGCCQQELDEHAVEDVISDEGADTPAEDSEFVKAVKRLMRHLATNGMADSLSGGAKEVYWAVEKALKPDEPDLREAAEGVVKRAKPVLVLYHPDTVGNLDELYRAILDLEKALEAQ